MSAVIATRTYAIPRGATSLERWSIRIAETLAQWATGRAKRREDRREAMLAAIQTEQTRKADPREADHLLAQMGMPRR